MWSEFTGGALIGLAAALLWLGIGRIAGISGVVANLFLLRQGHRNWSLYFFVGLLVSYPLYVRFAGLPDVYWKRVYDRARGLRKRSFVCAFYSGDLHVYGLWHTNGFADE